MIQVDMNRELLRLSDQEWHELQEHVLLRDAERCLVCFARATTIVVIATAATVGPESFGAVCDKCHDVLVATRRTFAYEILPVAVAWKQANR